MSIKAIYLSCTIAIVIILSLAYVNVARADYGSFWSAYDLAKNKLRSNCGNGWTWHCIWFTDGHGNPGTIYYEGEAGDHTRRFSARWSEGYIFYPWTTRTCSGHVGIYHGTSVGSFYQSCSSP